MAAIQNTTLQTRLAATTIPAEISPILSGFLWSYFDAHHTDVIVERKVWFLPVRITVGMLEPLFTRIAGPRPTSGITF